MSAEHQDPLQGLLLPLGPAATGTSMVGFITWHGGNLGSPEPESSIPKHHPRPGHRRILTILCKEVLPSPLTNALCPRLVEVCELVHLVPSPTSKQVLFWPRLPKSYVKAGRFYQGQLSFSIPKRTEGPLKICTSLQRWLVEVSSHSAAQVGSRSAAWPAILLLPLSSEKDEVPCPSVVTVL